ncbi:MAG: glycerate kinase [Oscillospiraceae bacterium]|nr:glycerate kinase [Oscillospiraceae bacterium]
MSQTLRTDAHKIMTDAINAVLPDTAVKRALEGKVFPGKVVLVAAGKAAWQMAKAAYDCLGERIDRGIVITKYAHVKGPIGNIACREAGHPVPDENSFRATAEAVELISDLQPQDTVLFLLSGGGSALFELPLISGEELQDITQQLLASGADITEINTIRKRLSKVKGGRFAQLAEPAQVFTVVLSDIIGDPLDMIASGPAYPDSSTCKQATEIAKKCGLKLSAQAEALLQQETPKSLANTETVVTGSVRELCVAAANACRTLSYETTILTDTLCCEAKEAGAWLAQIAKENVCCGKKLAFIAGGETVVKLTGNGKGGRNQELALSAAAGIDGMEGVAVFSIGSDGTDGPTDAAGGYVDWQTAEKLRAQNIHIADSLANNDAFHALEKVDGLIFTGPTGTNVNDVAVLLINQ